MTQTYKESHDAIIRIKLDFDGHLEVVVCVVLADILLQEDPFALDLLDGHLLLDVDFELLLLLLPDPPGLLPDGGDVPGLVMPHGVAELHGVPLRESLEPALAGVEGLVWVEQPLQLGGFGHQVLLL